MSAFLLLFSPLLGGVDPDAQAYFTAAGITDATQKTAYNAHVLRGRADGWYAKEQVAYPFIGGTFTAHKIDAINPSGTQLTKVNTVTDSANGVQGDGVSGYLLSGYNRNAFPQTVMSIGIYVRAQPTADNMDFGSVDNFGAGDTQFTSTYWAVNSFNCRNNLSGIPLSFSDELGATIFTRSATQDKLLIGSAAVAFQSQTTDAPTTNLAVAWDIFCLDRNGVRSDFSNAQLSYYARLNDELTLAQAIAYRNSINQLQTDLGRAVH